MEGSNIQVDSCGIRHVKQPERNDGVMDKTSISPPETRLAKRLARVGDLPAVR